MKHNRSIVLIFVSLISSTGFASDDSIKKMKEDRDKIAELKEEICKDNVSSRSECFKAYLNTVQVQEAPELVALSVAATDMYARDRLEWEDKEIQFRIAQIENWYGSIERVNASKFTKTTDQQALNRAKQKIMAKARDELKTIYEMLSKSTTKEIDQQKQKYRDLLQQHQKISSRPFAFPH